MLGAEMTVAEVLAEIEQDRAFYNRSGGGVTIGGGEPLAQFNFVLELLRRCKEKFLHTAIETCGHVPWEHLEKASAYLDLIYYDIKHRNPERHKELTGITNELILGNARKLLSGKISSEVIIRTEVIPGCNDSAAEIKDIARFVADAGGKKMELLPYHALGSAKYRELGLDYEIRDVQPPTDEQMKNLRQIVASFGLTEMTGVY